MLKNQTVNHVSEHLSAICPVYTVRGRVREAGVRENQKADCHAVLSNGSQRQKKADCFAQLALTKKADCHAVLSNG